MKLAACAAVAVFAVAALHHHQPAADLTGAARGGTLTCRGLEQLWVRAGGPPGSARTAASVAMAESSGRQFATNTNGGRSTDRGYWQINSVHGTQSAYGALANARSAIAISHHGTDWSPWVVWQTGAYQGKC